jgi:hypothetical protein
VAILKESKMKSFKKILAAGFALAVVWSESSAMAAKRYRFVDDHPTGGAGATGKMVFFNEGDPRFKIEPAGLCGQPFLGGTYNGHPDPRLADPKAVCGHGYVYETGVAEPPSRPLSIQPVTTPVAPEGAASSATGRGGKARRVIREQLTQLDRPEGDRLASVMELRSALHSADVAKAAKNVPKRQSK